MKNWQTSLAGVSSILLALCLVLTSHFDGDPATNPDWIAVASAIAAGVGLLRAQDVTKPPQ